MVVSREAAKPRSRRDLEAGGACEGEDYRARPPAELSERKNSREASQAVRFFSRQAVKGF